MTFREFVAFLRADRMRQVRLAFLLAVLAACIAVLVAAQMGAFW